MAHNTLTASKKSMQLDRLSPDWQRTLKDIPGALECIERIDFSTKKDQKLSKEGVLDVAVLREHLAALFEHAFMQLSSEDEANITEAAIKKTISTTILDMVIDAKEQGLDSGVCAHMLQPLLAIYATMPYERTEDVARALVANGLAPELIQATMDTEHLVYKEDDGWYGLEEKPLNRIAIQNEILIICALGHIPSALEYGGLEKQEDEYYYTKLSTKSLIALYANAMRSGEMQKASTIVNCALQNIINDVKENKFLQYSSASDIVSIIDFAQEAGLSELIGQTLEHLRVASLRGGRDTHEELVAALISVGKDDIAKMLLTPGKSTVRRYYMHEPETIHAIEQLEKQKEQELFEVLCAKGMPSDLEYFKKILRGSDPMSAFYIPDDFIWQTSDGHPSSEFKKITRDDPELTGSMGLLAMQVMKGYIDGGECIKFAYNHHMTLGERDSYFADFFSLLNACTDRSQEVITELLRHDDPNAIMRTSELLGMGEISTSDIQFLSRYVNSDPVIFEQIERLSDEIGHSLPMDTIKTLMREGAGSIEQRVSDILNAYDALNIEPSESPKMVTIFAMLEDVPICVDRLLTLKENAKINNTQLITVLDYLYKGYPIGIESLEGIIQAQQWMQEFGIGIEEILDVYYGDIRACLDAPDGKNQLLQVFASQQVRTAYQQKAQPLVGENIEDTSATARKDIILKELALPNMLLHRLLICFLNIKLKWMPYCEQ